MTVSKTSNYKPYFILTGTTAEVVEQLAADGVPPQAVIAIFYDGTNTVAIYHLGPR